MFNAIFFGLCIITLVEVLLFAGGFKSPFIALILWPLNGTNEMIPKDLDNFGLHDMNLTQTCFLKAHFKHFLDFKTIV